MSSVTKPLAASTSPVSSSRLASNSRQVSSNYGSVSELYAQTGVSGEGEQPGFDEFGQSNDGRSRNRYEQPQTLKLHGTSRTFAMLFEETNEGYRAANDDAYYDADGGPAGGKPAFQAYMANATSTYDLSTRVISGENKNRGGSINIAM